MISITGSGDLKRTRSFLEKLMRNDIFSDLDRFGRMGVDALSNATPVNSGLTSVSWGYRVIRDRRSPGIEWFNSNPAGNTSVAVLIQYGHGTGTGGYVQGRDFINPAMRPMFDRIADDVWKKVRDG